MEPVVKSMAARSSACISAVGNGVLYDDFSAFSAVRAGRKKPRDEPIQMEMRRVLKGCGKMSLNKWALTMPMKISGLTWPMH